MIELMVAVAIAVILAAAAIPQYNRYVGATTIDAQVSAVVASMRLARSEALKRAIPVTICPSANPEAATPSCSNSDATLGWGTGWIVFTDLNVRGQVDGSDTVIRVQPRFANSGGMLPSNTAQIMSFNANGILIGVGANGFKLPNKATPTEAANTRYLCVSETGSTRLSKTTC